MHPSDVTQAWIDSDDSCYINNVLYPRWSFSREAFTRCWRDFTVMILDHPTFGNFTKDESTLSLVFEEKHLPDTRNITRWDLSNNTIRSGENICSSLNGLNEFCDAVEMCVQMASSCCDRQIAQRNNLVPGHCPGTWDGLTCFGMAANGTDTYSICPETLAAHEGDVRKTCLPQGEWNSSSYDDCFNAVIDHYSKLITAGMVCKLVVIFSVIPACIIMLSFRNLRQQQRIRVHLCLLLASLLVAVSSLMWEFFIDYSILHLDDDPNVLQRNPVWCRLLHLFKEYSIVALFMWMFIEFFHLHRLLMHAFTVPRSLRFYYIFGFGFPLLMISIYGILRQSDEQLSKRCYISHSYLDLICNAPTLITLVVNLILLFRIVNVLVRQLAPHPNEPSSFRRALKAVVMMMPSLGIQYFMFLWTRPESYSTLRTVHDLLEEIVCSLHGTLIALVFCYFNKEIQTYLKAPCLRVLRRSSWFQERSANRSHGNTMSTQYGSEHNRIYKAGGSDGADLHGRDGGLPNGHTQESLIPLERIALPADSQDQADDYRHAQRGRSSQDGHLTDKLYGEVIMDDEVTHLDPGGHRD